MIEKSFGKFFFEKIFKSGNSESKYPPVEEQHSLEPSEYTPPNDAILVDKRILTTNGTPLKSGEIWLEKNDENEVIFVLVNGNRKSDSSFNLGLKDWTRYSVKTDLKQVEFYTSSTNDELNGKTQISNDLNHFQEWNFIAQQIIE